MNPKVVGLITILRSREFWRLRARYLEGGARLARVNHIFWVWFTTSHTLRNFWVHNWYKEGSHRKQDVYSGCHLAAVQCSCGKVFLTRENESQ